MSAQNVMVAEKKPVSTVVPQRSLGPQHHPSLLPGHAEDTPAPGGRSLDSMLTGPGLGHDFGQIRVHPEAETTQSVMKACPLGLSSPTACPFGGACHTCPATVQAKLAISEPGDKYEQEADRVAEQVMRMPEPVIQRAPT